MKDIVPFVLVCLAEWEKAHMRDNNHILSLTTSWVSGVESWVKLQSFQVKPRSNFSILGLLWVIRDHEERVVEGHSFCFEGMIALGVTEAISIREALSWIKTR
ncbi:hypothetical protein CsatA_011285 [Cannabis sativa]